MSIYSKNMKTEELHFFYYLLYWRKYTYDNTAYTYISNIE